jgi:adenosylhomocysteine nucleosidase
VSNSGVQNTGPGTVNMTGSAVGPGATVYNAPGPESHGRRAPRRDRPGSDVGIITVLSEETSAVVAALGSAGHCEKQVRDEARFYEAVDRLRRYYDPAVIALVGIAGGINPAVGLGDVVVVREVIYYDSRKETPGRVFRRGYTRSIPAGTLHAVNDFFSSNGEPCAGYDRDSDGTVRDYKILPGPIGSGEAVIADPDSDIRRYIAGFNDKTLAVETEAGGVAEAFYETAGSGEDGWLAIRGISDHADAAKDDTYHQIASRHAAAVLLRLVPFLVSG